MIEMTGEQLRCLEDEIYKRAVKTPFTERTQWLVQQLGARLTAASAGVADPRTVRSWTVKGAVEPREAAVKARMVLLYRITAWIIEGGYEPAVAVTFLQTGNPYLRGQAPVSILASFNPAEHDVETQLLNACRVLMGE